MQEEGLPSVLSSKVTRVFQGLLPTCFMDMHIGGAAEVLFELRVQYDWNTTCAYPCVDHWLEEVEEGEKASSSSSGWFRCGNVTPTQSGCDGLLCIGAESSLRGADTLTGTSELFRERSKLQWLSSETAFGSRAWRLSLSSPLTQQLRRLADSSGGSGSTSTSTTSHETERQAPTTQPPGGQDVTVQSSTASQTLATSTARRSEESSGQALDPVLAVLGAVVMLAALACLVRILCRSLRDREPTKRHMRLEDDDGVPPQIVGGYSADGDNFEIGDADDDEDFRSDDEGFQFVQNVEPQSIVTRRAPSAIAGEGHQYSSVVGSSPQLPSKEPSAHNIRAPGP
mmetsp:Transcript_7350/g.13021  ORF Transcript_7350/g.13021 Transcript_7350/m.13021 type:complete len:341 (-) Transcript_7350:126-1148(-)